MSSQLQTERLSLRKMTDPRSDDSFDVKFLVGPKQRPIHGHKFILASSSLVFHRMFYSNFRSNTEIVIPDIDADAFEMMINSIYGRTVNITANNIVEIFKVADKYDLALLRQICIPFVLALINSNNALTVFNQFLLFNEPSVNEKCLSIVLDDPLVYFGRPEFLESSADVIRSIFKQRYINCSLQDMKKALLTWLSKNQSIGIDKAKWMEAVEANLKITQDELEMKTTRHHLFRKYDYSITSEVQISTAFDMAKEGCFTVYGVGVVLGPVSHEAMRIKISATNATKSILDFYVVLEKNGCYCVNSIQDVFFRKIVFQNGLQDKLLVTILFKSSGQRPCVQFDKKDSFVSHLILSNK